MHSTHRSHPPGRRFLMAAALLLTSTAGALDITINGQRSAQRTITVNGRTYVPIEVFTALKVPFVVRGNVLALGAAGGANERPSLEGCVGDSLFNGVWRLKVTKLERIVKDGNTPGWGLTVEVRNGTRATLSPADAGINYSGAGIQLAFADATTLPVDALDVQKLTLAALPQGGAVNAQLKFYAPSGAEDRAARAPSKFLLEVDAKGVGDTLRRQGVAFTTPTPSFRVRLDCAH